MKNGDYVIAPLWCAKYLTAGKKYKVFDVEKKGNNIFFVTTCDEGFSIFTQINKSPHLNGQDWILATESESFLKEVDNPIGDFLEKNGFELSIYEIDSFTKERYVRNDTTIEIFNSYYKISSKEGDVYSQDLNIYWLIGYLTYNGIIKKNYKI